MNKFRLKKFVLFGTLFFNLLSVTRVCCEDISGIFQEMNQDNGDHLKDFKISPEVMLKFEKAFENSLIYKDLESAKLLTDVKKTNNKGLSAFYKGDKNTYKIHKLSSIAIDITQKLSSYFKYTGLKVISRIRLPDIFCPTISKNCDSSFRYRQFDGSCNNLLNSWWGEAKSPFKRLLPPEYDDKVNLPRKKSFIPGRQLPNPRVVANVLHESKYKVSDYTQFFTYFAQSIGRDIASIAPITDAQGIEKICQCGSSDIDCLNINIPNDEKFILTQPCLPFTRSAASVKTFECYLGAREQLNLVSHYLDLTQIYGSSDDESALLRGSDGILSFTLNQNNQVNMKKINQNLECDTLVSKCYQSGDKRTEDSSILSSVHTIWLREHNNLAIRLRELNPDWHEDKVFFEARKINIAQYQHIIYNEWLPILIGNFINKEYELYSVPYGHINKYKIDLSPSLSNEFATAAFRLHNLINFETRYSDASLYSSVADDIGSFFYNMKPYNKDSDSIIRGLISSNSYFTSPQINPTLNNKLFEPLGFLSSLGAINNQRGRDHGLPPYYKYREYCGLGKVKSFEDLNNIPFHTIVKLKQLYSSVYDIDLYAGGVSELPVKDGVVGPTFACIIAKQFYDLKYGDRFFYENEENRVTRFSKPQLNEIKKTTMARILCNNVNLMHVPRNPFLKQHPQNNPLINCASIPKLLLNPWYVNSTEIALIQNYLASIVN